MGGKRRLAKRLLPMFPEHTCYVEPFCGGAALFFLRPEPAKAEVLNDINGQLINLYRVVQHHFDEFVRQFEWTLTGREVFARLQSTPPEAMTDIQRAARFFYLQHNAFGGKTAGQHFGTATTARAWNAADIAGRLKAAQQRLGGVIIENEAWDKCFKRYDREHTFFYLDPPYWQTAGYDRAFDWPQYELLAKMMAGSKGKAMLSINDHPDIRELFKDFRTERLELAYSVSRDKTPKTSGELVICNW
ncbi:DNA adenine methylase [Neisseria animalis]|uniref:site-specific DNA-methyltransferase (adenine-specific) n=2 Tax=Neisseria animalis TaxID=492 RepID=A0A5P3MTW7_NEIAN|nr:DNA adenine methylase [Neisseria animalis]ROW32251.1 DNA adenine methylase [Neisseria animalis]